MTGFENLCFTAELNRIRNAEAAEPGSSNCWSKSDWPMPATKRPAPIPAE